MKARLKALPDELRGGAWPSPVRTVKHPVKSGNERDPRPQLPAVPFGEAGHTEGTAGAKPEEGGGHGRSACPETPGLHAGYNGGDSGLPTPKGGGNPSNPAVVGIEGCNSPS